jgi:Mg-chelatase subunit ChlD
VTIKPAKYFKDDAALTADTVTAEVEINATSSIAVREGLDLVAVLDVSGTMAEEKLESMKRAMAFVIMKLTPVDRLSIVTFSDGATRLNPLRSMTAAAQDDLKGLVNGLEARGPTNIKAGLETGLAVLAGRVHTNARTANIFLMSDGHQNAGDNAGDVDPGQVTVYSFGFGQHTDHKLMSDIARKSPGGTFSSVPDGSQVSVPFSQLLAGLLTVVAQDVELTFTPNPQSDEQEVETIEVARGTDYTTTPNGPSSAKITIKFGTLFAGEGRRVVITLKLQDVSDKFDEEYDATLAEAQHSFTAQGRPKDPQLPQDIQIRRTPSPSQAPGESSKAREVQAEIARRNHAEAIRQARLLADAGELEEARYKVVDAQNALEDIVVDRLEDGKKLVSALRAELAQLLKLMETKELYEAQGRAYALASETCHGRQRYAARGGDEGGDVRLFATPRMDTYREQAKNFEKNPTAPVPTADEDLKQEILANPISAVSTELAYHLRMAIQSLQAIERIVAPSN